MDFDAIMSSSDSHTQTVTHRPVEEGFEAFDAIHQNPPTLNISLLIADTPQSIIDVMKMTNLANTFGFNILNSFVSRQLNTLELIYSAKETVSIVTKYREYKGYYIEDRSFEETSDEGIVIALTLIKKRVNKLDDAIGNYSNAIGVFT